MRKLLKRWYVWLALFLLLALIASAALIYSNWSRSTQANFDRIQREMSEAEVVEILGKPTAEIPAQDGSMSGRFWRDDPNYVIVWFDRGKVRAKGQYLATTWETLEWYAEKGWEKIKKIGN